MRWGCTGPPGSHSLQDGALSNPVASTTTDGGTHALPARTHLLQAVAAERPFAQAHREPLREQLRRGAAAPERDRAEAAVARFRRHAGLRDQRAQARGARRAQFDAAPRALFRPPRPLVQPEFGDLPGVTPEEVKAMIDAGKAVQIIDARPRHSVSRTQDIMEGATWKDPERVQEWADELSKSEPVVVFCVYGFHVGCKMAMALREAGYDASYMK